MGKNYNELCDEMKGLLNLLADTQSRERAILEDVKSCRIKIRDWDSAASRATGRDGTYDIDGMVNMPFCEGWEGLAKESDKSKVTAEPNQIKVGDVVRLKSGGPKLTVSNLCPFDFAES